MPSDQRDRAGERLGIGTADRRRAPDDLDALVQDQDQPEGREHLVEMVAVIEMAEDQEFEGEPEERAPPPGRARGREEAPVSAAKVTTR